jgi:hypothetical protein
MQRCQGQEAVLRWRRASVCAATRRATSTSTAPPWRRRCRALAQALSGDGPALIDVHVDPSGYLAQSVALRG